MNHAHVNALAYDTYPDAFDAEFESHMRRYNMGHVEAFLTALPGKRVLDIGCGPGNYAAVFVQRGFDVLCGDLSSAMVELCRRKGLRAEQMDLESFSLGERFDGVWANASLLHLPKIVVPDVIARLARHLMPNGIFACAVKEGDGEGLKDDESYPGTPRYYSYFRDEEFRILLAPHFEILQYERTASTSGRTVFLKYLCRQAAA